MKHSTKTKHLVLIIMLVLITNCGSNDNPLAGKVIVIDPGHGGTAETDSYRVGRTGEREEWINLRVALHLAEMLKQADAEVILTRSEDNNVSLRARADTAVASNADVFVSIHHNATADTSVNFPIIYFHGNASENLASVKLGEIVVRKLRETFYGSKVNASLASDFVIFPSSGTAVLRYSYGIPGIIGEASFFTNREEEARLKNDEYNRKEAVAYFNALKEYFSNPVTRILPKYSEVKLEPFKVFSGAERMNPIALDWHSDYKRGAALAESDKKDTLIKAESLLVQSIKSFPDSYLARDAQLKRYEILNKLGKKTEADTALMRAKEFYIPLSN